MAVLSLIEQVAKLETLLRELPPERRTKETLTAVADWLKDIPHQFLSSTFSQLLSTTFNVSVEEAELLYVRHRVSKETSTTLSEALVPAHGWLREYYEYTSRTEPPTLFHLFTGLTILGATMGRNVFFDKGSGPIFPNLCVVLVAPAGICRKTTAINIGVDMFRAVGGTVLADRSTPEAIVEAFKDKTAAVGLICAPELSVFLGKQKYLEGLVPMLTALFDCPASWSSATVMRGEARLYSVALSELAASTADWLQTAIPKDAFGGGFMSRQLLIVQNTTDRCFPIPPPLDKKVRSELIKGLLRVQKLQGGVTLTDEAASWWDSWYRKRRLTSADKQFAGYFQRKPDHLLRIALCLNASYERAETALYLTQAVLEQALSILDRAESLLPSLLEELGSTAAGADRQRMLKQIRLAGGKLMHSVWMRKNAAQLNAEQFRRVIDTMKQAREITYDAQTRVYYLLPGGWRNDEP